MILSIFSISWTLQLYSCNFVRRKEKKGEETWENLLLTFVLVALALDTEYSNNHYDDDDGSSCQSYHKPCLSIERLLLQIAIFQIQLRRRQNSIFGVGRIRNSVFVVGNHPESVGCRRKQTLVADCKFLQSSTCCACHSLPSLVICENYYFTIKFAKSLF